MRLSGAAVDRLCPGDGCRLHRIPRPVAALYALWRGCRRPSSQACDHAVVRYGASCGGGGDCSARLAPHPPVLALAHPLAALWPGRQLLSAGVHGGGAAARGRTCPAAASELAHSVRQPDKPCDRPPTRRALCGELDRGGGSIWPRCLLFPLLGGMSLLLLRFPDASAPSQETPGEASGAQRGIFADIREGMRFVARVPWLW